jgi:uncharacterized membrane protein YgdD (TMEM256/DUF423 family)
VFDKLSMPNPRNLPLISFLGLLAVVFGAFGSHSLRGLLNPELYHAWQTAIEYQFYHTLALFLCSFIPKKRVWYQRPEFWFLAGIICFSGSIYLLALLSLKSIHANGIGILTPIGGLFFILGWLSLLLSSRFENEG